MRVYTAHLRPQSTAPDRELVLVREGFSWGAALLPLLWALWHRMWIVAAILLGLSLLLAAAQQALLPDPGVALPVWIGVAALLGLSGNDLRRWTLDRGGWQEAGVVSGRDADAAALRLLDALPDLFDAPAAAPAVAATGRPAERAAGWNQAWPDAFGPGLGGARDGGGWRVRRGS